MRERRYRRQTLAASARSDGATGDLLVDARWRDATRIAGMRSDDELPTTDLLTPRRRATSRTPARGELDLAGDKLMATLRTFKVEGELVGRTTGPTVTQFEIEPAAGVKVRQIAALADDLALAMRAPSIRIVAPIPGRGAVGVEVPNPSPEMVVLREVLESREFQSARAALPVALGKDLEGHAVVADLAKMPHLLIAGATGSRQVGVREHDHHEPRVPAHAEDTAVPDGRPEDGGAQRVQHAAASAAQGHHGQSRRGSGAQVGRAWRCRTAIACSRRMRAATCRSSTSACSSMKPARGPRCRSRAIPKSAFEDRTYTAGILPYIVVVIDEMADLMMTVQGEVETPIAMLAQKARAIGIHLILATQRPSVNVITGSHQGELPVPHRVPRRVAG